MKIYMFILWSVLFLWHTSVFAQNKSFREDYKYVKFYENGEWGRAIQSNTIIVFNINNNTDFIIYFPDGVKQTFRSISQLYQTKTDNGISYEYMEFIDEEGQEVRMVYTENGETVLIIKNSKLMTIMFTNTY